MHDDVMDGSATRRGTPTIHVEFADQPRRRPVAGRGRGASARAWPSSSATWPASTPIACSTATPPDGSPGLERAEDRAQRRPVPRRARHRPGRHRPGHRPAHRPLQVRQVHDRATAAPRRRAGRAARRAAPVRSRPTAIRSARPSSCATTCSARSATARVTGKPVGDDLREGKPTPLLAIAIGRVAAIRRRGPARPRRRPDLDDDEVAALQAPARHAAVPVGEIETTIAALTERAVEAIDAAPLDRRGPRRLSRWSATWPASAERDRRALRGTGPSDHSVRLDIRRPRMITPTIGP